MGIKLLLPQSRSPVRYAEDMKLLVEKYGDPYKIANAYIKKVNDWPCIRQRDDQALDRFATFLTQCRSAMSEITFLSILGHPHSIQVMVKKRLLPLQDRWPRESSRHRVVRSITPTFASLVTFVKTEAGIATDSVFSREALSRLDVPERPDRFNKGRNANKPRTCGDRFRTTSHVSSHATTVVTAPINEKCGPENLCEMCGKSHDLDDCKVYLKKSLIPL